ncbi:MAG: hypothetical protein IPK12_00800 [Gemmatimonadetes bacterium]|nr:hypothetical protein [Gemmatimonadota bacterium]
MRLNTSQGLRAHAPDAGASGSARSARPAPIPIGDPAGGLPGSEDDLFRDPFSDHTPSGR